MKILNRNAIIVITGAVMLMTGVGAYALTRTDSTPAPTQIQSDKPFEDITVDNTDAGNPVPAKTTEEQLLYLIEEEKLAHDIYQKMYELYGSQVFGNILESESTHQDRVASLLKSRSISDPRTGEVGTFKNIELQELYDQLLIQGSQSVTEAYQVGVVIEEKDIADISNQLATTTDSDVIDTLENLRRGSENHLRAFNRKLR